MTIKFTLNGTPVVAVLEDNATTRDFLALLPLKVKLEDFAATEKIAYLPSKLSTKDAPSAIVPKAGDVTYYAPWGNLALFHKDFRRSPELVKLGRIIEGFDALKVAGTAEITIERADAQ
ncbi:cyclophilin-like fold protein [Brucella intermedia]|uniref:cyclophilin-like fold protein n=2 Tax=Brucella intermedia TaxID=94625 RepID=UPI00068B04D3|nr:cyclophilin-like fold protein [Brucella intermedia]